MGGRAAAGAVADGGIIGAAGGAAHRRGVSPVAPGDCRTLWFALLVAAPWVYLAPWRPAGLPPTSVELAFIASKLSGRV